uniref:Uncharacterized protein n=1 Tax=Dunaliella tertiolecta TaxID=3047 RepID=A0A7S3QQB9_DUNTE
MFALCVHGMAYVCIYSVAFTLFALCVHGMAYVCIYIVRSLCAWHGICVDFMAVHVSSNSQGVVNPDEAVALGAAVQAGVLQGEVKDLMIIDQWQVRGGKEE